MRKVILYSVLLIIGFFLSQTLPWLLDDYYNPLAVASRLLTMLGLAYIMIHVGFEFHINKSELGQYGWDYVVAFTAAAFPWIFVSLYFIFVMLPAEYWQNFDAWKEVLLAGRFAAPTSAGVLFSMLAAAGLGSTWLFKKARILAIFDDLDTVLLMIPLKMMMVGVAWQLGFIVLVMFILLWIAYEWLHKIRLPLTWRWILFYSIIIVIVSEALHAGSTAIDPSVPIHLEVLLPAFVLGCIARPSTSQPNASTKQVEADMHAMMERKPEKRAATIVSAIFMVLVGLSMPNMFEGTDYQHPSPTIKSMRSAAPASGMKKYQYQQAKAAGTAVERITAQQPSLGWAAIIMHVIFITLISNLGKMFPAFCYRKQAHWRERLAVAICMWTRGEVGAGILVLSISYGIGGPIVTVAMLSLAVNLILTGVFIVMVKRLTAGRHLTQ